jgi:predicted Zn finger-like uncharacterized protein
MSDFKFLGDPVGQLAASSLLSTNVPAVCPACQSSSIVTTAKVPDDSSYWRCTNCGNVWNNSRRNAVRKGGAPWR